MNQDDGRSQDAQSWKVLYEAAILEIDTDLRPRKVLEAQQAIAERALYLLREASEDEPELQELAYATLVLCDLRRMYQSDRSLRLKGRSNREKEEMDDPKTGTYNA